jgi:hypothetical protein
MRRTTCVLLVNLLCMTICPGQGRTGPVHVWERVEVTLIAANAYDNPYAGVEVWVISEGPKRPRRLSASCLD